MELKERTELDRPMYIKQHQGKMYAVLRQPFSDNDNSGIISFDIAKNGSLINPSKIISTKGQVGCHIAFNVQDIYCANYRSGSVIKLPDKLVIHNGKGKDVKRQEKPHVHFVEVFDRKYVFAADLGLDTVFMYDLNLNLIASAKVPDGFGVRHFIISNSKKLLYTINELVTSISIFKILEGQLQYISTVMCDIEKGVENFGAAIRLIDDKLLIISNRGGNDLQTFLVQDQTLIPYQKISSFGNWPRDFFVSPDNKFLIAVNEFSNSLTVYEINNYLLKHINTVKDIISPLGVVINKINT
jgi:6-phosphogluconolactonase